MQRTQLRLRFGAFAALAATAAVGLHAQQQSATTLVDKADPTKSFAASSQPAVGDLFPVSETLFVDTSKKRVAIGRTSADTSLHVQGNVRITWNGLVNENIGSGSLQMTNFNYDRGWSGDQFGFQPYGGPLQLDRLAKSGVDASSTLYVRPGGLVGIGVPNPVMQLDVKGVVRASDTIVSTKSAGAPFLIASTDLTKNLNADLLDGKSAEEFATAAEVAALSAAVAAAGSTGGSTTTVASLMDDGRFTLPESSGTIFDDRSGIVFPDGTMQTTAYAPTTAVARVIGTLQVTLVSTPALEIMALDVDLPNIGAPIAVRARLTKRVDELSGHLLADLAKHAGQHGDHDSFEPNNDVIGDLVLALPDLLIAPNGAPVAAGARLVLTNPRVTSIEQRQSTNLHTSTNQPSAVLVEDVELLACGLRIEALEGSLIYAQLGQGAPTAIGGAASSVVIDVAADKSIAFGTKSKVVPLRSIEYQVGPGTTEGVSPLSIFVGTAHSENLTGLTRGCNLDMRVLHPHLLTSAANLQAASVASPIQRVTSRLLSGSTPVVDVEFNGAHARTWRLRSGAHGEYHVEVDLASQEQIRRTRTSTGQIQTVTIVSGQVTISK